MTCMILINDPSTNKEAPGRTGIYFESELAGFCAGRLSTHFRDSPHEHVTERAKALCFFARPPPGVYSISTVRFTQLHATSPKAKLAASERWAG